MALGLLGALLRRHARRSRDDRGTVSVLVAVLLSGTVLLGMCAIVVDAGQLYAEREELQSGADAGALAVARNCANSPSSCATQAASIAARYADDNAKDSTSAVTTICGTGSGLPACPAQPTNMTACLGPAPAGALYAEVRTATRLPDGSTLLPPSFAQSLVGMRGYQGSTVAACSRVAWGPPSTATGLAIGVSRCNWQAMTSNGTVLPTDERMIYLHDPKGADPDSASCPKDPSGKTAPGGFGFLAANAGTCMVTGDAGTDWGGSPGNSSHGCDTPLGSYRASGKPIPLPIYDNVSGNGANTTYHVIGFGAFVVTGWKLSGTSMASNIPPAQTAPRAASSYCSGPDRCLYGYFTTQLMTTGQFGGASYGISLLKTVG